MKRIIFIIFVLLTTKLSIAQSNQTDSIEEILDIISPISRRGILFYETYKMLVRSDEQRYIFDQNPTERVSTDNNGDFYLTDTRMVSFSVFQSLSEICKDTIDGRKTFYFTDEVYTDKDIITIRTLADDLIENYKYSPDSRIYYRAYGMRGAIINGKKEGLWEKFKPNHETNFMEIKMINENYRDGLLHGFRFCYDHYGKIVSNEFFFNGTGYCLYHYPDGKVAAQGALVNGKRHGKWEYFDQQTIVARIEHYNAGLLHGRLIVKDSSGAELYRTTFKNGTGQYREYQGNRITLEGSMVNGQRVGKWNATIKIRYPEYVSEKLGVIEERKGYAIHETDDPINNPKCFLDQTYIGGKWVYVMAQMDK